jgi:small subunit ribosomal protein S8
MATNDPIADMLSTIKNATQRQTEMITVPATKQVEAVAQILKQHGFVTKVERVETKPQDKINITIAYKDEVATVTDIKRISKPGVRIYKAVSEIKRVRNGLGVGIYSTSKGILDDKQAVAAQVGGEYLCEIW